MTYPAGHEAEPSETTTNTQCTFPAELDSHETEGLVTRRDESKVSTTEQIRGKGCKLGFGVHAIRVELHETSQFLRRESTV